MSSFLSFSLSLSFSLPPSLSPSLSVSLSLSLSLPPSLSLSLSLSPQVTCVHIKSRSSGISPAPGRDRLLLCSPHSEETHTGRTHTHPHREETHTPRPTMRSFTPSPPFPLDVLRDGRTSCSGPGVRPLPCCLLLSSQYSDVTLFGQRGFVFLAVTR